jgi:hypothetical protein
MKKNWSWYQTIIFHIKCHFIRHINYKMGMLSGIFTGSVVFAINYNHGFWAALAGFAKQFAFNLFMAGYNTKTCEKLVRYIRRSGLSVMAATVIPTLQAFVVLYSIHYFGGTPKPMSSTLWQALANLAIFYTMARYYSQKQLQPATLKSVKWQKQWWKPRFKRNLFSKAG